MNWPALDKERVLQPFTSYTICFTVTIFLIMTFYQLHATFSGSKWCLKGNTWALRKHLPSFLRGGHHFVLYVLNGEATLGHKLHKLFSFFTVSQQTNKCCFKKQHQSHHAWGRVWLFYDLQCISGRQHWGQFEVAVFYSRANHIHSVWVRCPRMSYTRESENSWPGLWPPCFFRRLPWVPSETTRLSTHTCLETSVDPSQCNSSLV